MGDSGSPPVFASPRVKEKVVNLASNLGAKYVWKTTTADNMRGEGWQRASWATFAEHLDCVSRESL